jgi:protocatechuate 3,4-dioxygenase beta subunit
MNRRKMLALLGAAGAAAFAVRAAAQAPSKKPNNPQPACVITPEQTEGPYFVDERLRRSDIRVDPADGSIKAGVPLKLRLLVSAVGNGGCRPLAGAMVDVWHCDALGVYSDVEERAFKSTGKKFLRGYQVTDASGAVEFTTIYPGWYPGRAVHIHFKVRADPKAARARELTSQLYFDEAITDKVYARMPYSARGRRTLENQGDGIFRDGGRQLMLALTEDAQGYAATFSVGMRI